MDLIIAPDLAALSNIAALCCIDARQNANAFAVFGVLAHGDVDAVLVENRRGVNFAWSFSRGVFELLAFGRVAVVFPNRSQEGAIAFFYWLGIKGVAPAVTTPKKDFLAAIHNRQRGRTPLAMENALADVRIVFAEELTSLRIQRDEAGRVWRRNVGMRPVLTIRSTNINNAVHDENRAVGSIVWKYAELIHHVVAPDNIAVFRSGLDGRRGTFRGFAAVCEYVFNEIFAFLFEG